MPRLLLRRINNLVVRMTMQNQGESDLSSLQLFEETFAKKGILPVSNDPNAEIYKARHNEENLKGEALAMVGKAHLIEKARGFLKRGSLKEADNILNRLKAAGENDTLLEIEILLEKSKLETYKANWKRAVEYATEALSMGPNPLTGLTLLQVRSLAFYESNQLGQAIEDVQRVESLESLYPHASGVFYAKIIRIKCVARLHGIDKTMSAFETLWGPKTNLNCDKILTLSRLAIDLHFEAGKDCSPWSLASYLVAKRLGEKLYIAEALADLAGSGDRKLSQFAEKELLLFGQDEERVLKRLEKRVKQKEKIEEIKLGLDSFESINSIVFSQHQFVLDLSEKKILCGEKKKQLFEALKKLAGRHLDKEEFYRAHWGLDNFDLSRHDNLIRNVMSRIRKTFQVEVLGQNHQLTVPGAFVVGAL